jgi:hypothetical protein
VDHGEETCTAGVAAVHGMAGQDEYAWVTRNTMAAAVLECAGTPQERGGVVQDPTFSVLQHSFEGSS